MWIIFWNKYYFWTIYYCCFTWISIQNNSKKCLSKSMNISERSFRVYNKFHNLAEIYFPFYQFNLWFTIIHFFPICYWKKKIYQHRICCMEISLFLIFRIFTILIICFGLFPICNNCWTPAAIESGFGIQTNITKYSWKYVRNISCNTSNIHVRYLTKSIIQFIKAIFCALVTATCARWFFYFWWISQWANFLHQSSFPFQNSLFIMVAIEITLPIKFYVCREIFTFFFYFSATNCST